ncbi:MAG: hypothetical protein KDB00_26140 [Planctomycetales bacterium]|nr:hypothetical protein [Planctomycetales bacterium]
MDQINPYQPPRTHLDFDADLRVLTFDGQVTEADYMSMMPDRRVLSWVLWVVLALFVPLAVFFAVMSVTLLLRRGFSEEAIYTGFGAVFIGGVCAASVSTMGSKSRARRSLRRHRDLLCIARGRLSERGMVISNGTSTYWTAPSELGGAGVFSNGVRIPVDQNPFRYFALADHLFDHFSAASAKQIKQSWLNQTALSSGDQWESDPFGAQLGPPWSSEEFSSPTNVQFSGTVTAQFPLKSPALIVRCKGEMISIVFWTFGLVVALFFGSLISALVCCGLAAIGVYNFVQYWRRYHYGTRTDQWNQAGWIGAEAIAWRSSKRAVYLSLNQIVGANVTDELATLYGPAGELLLIPRDQVADEAGWESITRRFRTDGR